MDVIYERCCGLDVHKRTVAACLIVPGMDGAPQKEIRTFGTMTEDLLELTDWLAAGCTHVAMESTGVYWKPIYNLLEAAFTPLLVNARHIKTVPGRKTDVKDCEWIADLLRHGLLRGSFVPERPQRELRELGRYRTTLTTLSAGRTRAMPKTRLPPLRSPFGCGRRAAPCSPGSPTCPGPLVAHRAVGPLVSALIVAG